MKIKFLGGVKHLTGSCSWLNQEEKGVQFLVDCGQYQGGDSVESYNFDDFEFYPGDISFVLLTHAHLDHCGLIPKLYTEGFTGKVYCTSATAKLAKIVLEDSANLMKNHSKPLFSKADVDLIDFSYIDERPDFKWGKDQIIGQDLSITWLRSSHILGACGITVSWETVAGLKSMHFSGDIGNNMDSHSYLPLLKSNQVPFSTAQYILTESTYGGRSRDAQYKSSENRLERLNYVLTSTLQGEGRVVIPAFSVHRTQEVFVDLWAWITKYLVDQRNRLIADRPVKLLVHSPMGMKVNQVFSEELFRFLRGNEAKYQYLGEDLEDHIGEQYDPDENNRSYTLEDFVRWVFKNDFSSPENPDKTPKDYLKREFYLRGDSSDDMPVVKVEFSSKKVDKTEDWDIVVASSGMANAGPVVEYLNDIESDPHSSILITGFQAPSTSGLTLKERAISAFEELVFDPFAGVAKVIDFSSFYSGHADQDVIMEYLFNIGRAKKGNASTVFINHGSPGDKKALEDAVTSRIGINSSERNIERVIQVQPESGWFDLDLGEFSDDEPPIHSIDGREILNELKKLNHLMKLMLQQHREYFEWLKASSRQGGKRKK